MKVVHKSKSLLIVGHHTYRLRAPLIHVAYVSKTVDDGLRVGPTFRSAQLHEEILEQLRIPLHHRHRLVGGIGA